MSINNFVRILLIVRKEKKNKFSHVFSPIVYCLPLFSIYHISLSPLGEASLYRGRVSTESLQTFVYCQSHSSRESISLWVGIGSLFGWLQ